jgi:Zn-dependent M28 family amino/carboxypeptidase
MSVLTALTVATLAAIAPTPAEKTAAKQLTPELLRAHVQFLSSDLLEGRAPATQGDQLTQQYIAAQFAALGLKPAAPDGTYFQRFDIVGTNGNPDTLTFTAGAEKKATFKYRDDFMAVSGLQTPETRLTDAELVFVGYGIQAPEYGWDDYKGVDVRGKVLVMMNNDPADDPKLFAGKARLYYGRWDYKFEIANKLGAAGAIVIHTTPSAGYGWNVIQTSWAGEQFDAWPQDAAHVLQFRGWLTEDASRKVFALTGKDLDALRATAETREFKPVPLGVKLSTRFANEVKKKQTANVLALLPGSHPTLSKQWVAYTAHHDHLGRKEGANPGEDDIYNGAQDNASGVAQVIGIAKAFTSLPKAPPRSILFAAVAAEEAGLLGSQYLAEHPPIPAGRIAGVVNVDGANIFGRTKDVTIIGMGKSSFDGVITAMAKSQGRVTKADPLSDRGFFYRSDQFSFAKVGVPATYFDAGVDYVGKPAGWGEKQRAEWERTNYHQPSDQLTPDWNFDGAVQDAQLYFFVGSYVARDPKMPTWNKGDEFEGIRKKSLEAAK